MKSTRHISLPVLAVLTMASCKSIYEPNLVNIPLMQHKNEVVVVLDPKNIQAAYAVTDHVAVMANGFYTYENAASESEKQGGDGRLVEAAVGYYKPIRGNLVFETYGGFGLGNATLRNTIQNSSGELVRQTFNADAFKYFIQPDIGYKSKYADVAFAARLSVIDYQHPSTTNYPQEDIERDELGEIGKTPYVFIEPALVVRSGYKFVKLQLQYCPSIKLSSAPMNYKTDFLSLGLYLNFNNPKYK